MSAWRAAAAMAMCALAPVAWAQRPTPARVANLIHNFPQLRNTPDPLSGGYVFDPTIRKELAPQEAERAYSEALSRLLTSELTRSLATSQLDAARSREQSRNDDVIFAQLAKFAAEHERDQIEQHQDDPGKAVTLAEADKAVEKTSAALKAETLQLEAAHSERLEAEGNAAAADTAYQRISDDEIAARALRNIALPAGTQNFCSSQGLAIQRNTLLVRFADGVSTTDIRTILQRHSVHVVAGLPEISLFIVELDPITRHETDREHWARLTQTAGALAGEKPQVIGAVTQNLLHAATTCSNGVPVVKRPCWQWFTANESGQRSAALMRLPQAWDFLNTNRPNGGGSVPVAVLDTEFAGNADLLSITPVCPSTPCYHGSQVAGLLIGASGNSWVPADAAAVVKLVEVTAPIIPLGCEGDSAVAFIGIVVTLRDLVVAHKARVVNFSLGYNWSDFTTTPTSQRTDIQDLVAVQGAIVRDLLSQFSDEVVVVAAAGNDGDAAVYASPMNWAALAQTSVLGTPPALNILVVQSSDCTGSPSSFSNTGGSVRAPGEDLLTCEDGTNSDTDQGTSLSAPIVSGIAALMLAQNPALKPSQVVSIIKQSQMLTTVDALTAIQMAKTTP